MSQYVKELNISIKEGWKDYEVNTNEDLLKYYLGFLKFEVK